MATHYRSVHYLRGIAAMMILILHTVLMGGYSGWFPQLGFGVHLFFVISGFVMYSSTANRFDWRDYVYRRATRIYPIYWFALLFAVVVGMATPTLSDMLLIGGSRGPVYWQPGTIGIAWTLVYEVMFYAVFGIAMALGRWWLAPIAVIALVVFQSLLGPLEPYGNPIILEFAAGVLLGRFAHRMSPWLLVPAFILMVLPSGEVGSLFRAVKLGSCAFCLIGGGIALERFIPDIPVLRVFGDASYSIYLFHVPVIFALGSAPWYVTTLPAIAVGLLAHRLIEKPTLKALKRIQPPFQSLASS
ncbi:acyltransferase family protein [Qipengyuania sp. DGS5-3]|uniref:acyltransferase family protein n=1 Tax=Qipengyuania sp. DGS5-3 TaxID=3349632 RepID=UPI0036D2B45D